MSEKKRRNVVVRITVEMVIDVPDDRDAAEPWWTESGVNFYLNDSSHCLGADLVRFGEAQSEAFGDGECITCHRATGEYVREATAEDVERLGVPLSEKP